MATAHSCVLKPNATTHSLQWFLWWGMGVDLWVWAIWELDPQGPPEPAGNTARSVDTQHGTGYSIDCGYATWNRAQHSAVRVTNNIE